MITRNRTALAAMLLGAALMVAAPVVAKPPAGAGGGNGNSAGPQGNAYGAGGGNGNSQQGGTSNGFAAQPGNSGNTGNSGNSGNSGGGSGGQSGSEQGSSQSSGGGGSNGGGTSQAGGNPDRPSGKTTICHATGSDTNPYVVITPSNNSLDAHGAHQNEEDVIPAPAGVDDKGENCVASVTPPTAEPPREEPPGTTPPTDDGEVSPDEAERVKGVQASGDEGKPAAAAEAVGRKGGDELPFTGLGIGAMLLTAVLLIGGGWAVRFRGFLTIGA